MVVFFCRAIIGSRIQSSKNLCVMPKRRHLLNKSKKTHTGQSTCSATPGRAHPLLQPEPNLYPMRFYICNSCSWQIVSMYWLQDIFFTVVQQASTWLSFNDRPKSYVIPSRFSAPSVASGAPADTYYHGKRRCQHRRFLLFMVLNTRRFEWEILY